VPLIALNNVQKSFASWSLFHGVDLVIGEGARIGVVGPNGAGKSTLLRILNGTEPIEGGLRTFGKGVVTAYLPQQVEADHRTAPQTVLAARPDVAGLDEELRAC
jgi:ATPase subunit of ABC transporter with duplicated ATPase domains